MPNSLSDNIGLAVGHLKNMTIRYYDQVVDYDKLMSYIPKKNYFDKKRSHVQPLGMKIAFPLDADKLKEIG